MDLTRLLKICAIILAAFVLLAAILPAFGFELSDEPFVLIPEAENPQNAKNSVIILGETKNKNGNTFWEEYNYHGELMEEDGIGDQLTS